MDTDGMQFKLASWLVETQWAKGPVTAMCPRSTFYVSKLPFNYFMITSLFL